MNAFFAKYVFATLNALLPGQDAWPGYQPSAQGVDFKLQGYVDGEIFDAMGPVGTPQLRQSICVQTGGIYTVGFQLGMYPLPASSPDVVGWVELRTPSEAIILTHFVAAAGEWTLQKNTVTVQLPPGTSCMQLRYASSGVANINPDPRATFLTVHRVAQE